MFHLISRRFHPASLAIPAMAAGLVLAGSAGAQTLYGNLTGNVTDASNASVAGASVTVRSSDTGLTRTATTDNSGIYQLTDLPPGTYDVTITGTGFGSVATRGVPVGANQTKRIDAALTVGGVSQSVDVNTAPPALQTDRADVNYEITQTQVAQLPTTSSAGRNFQGLYRLIPGIPPPQEMNSQAANPGRTESVNANGVANTINSTKIDGAAVGYPWLQSEPSYIPPTDAIESANIVTNSFNAEQGAAGGIAANLIVKTGTNHFHGGAWEYNSISQFNARNYFTRVSSTAVVPKNIYNEFGGNIGGPIVKDKLFFFFDYNKVTLRQFKSGSMTVPLSQFRNGDFSSIVNGAAFGNSNFTPAQTLIYDPSTGDAQGRNKISFLQETGRNAIPTSRLSAPALKLLALLPAQTNNASIAGNYVGGQVLSYNRGTYDTKVNYNPTDKSTLFGRYSIQRSLITDPPAFGAAVGTTWDGGQPGNSPGTIQNVGLGATHTLTPNLLIDANAGFVRINLATRAPDVGTDLGLNLLGIPGTNGTTDFQSGLPGFNMSNGLSNFGNFTNSNPFHFRDMQYVGNVNATYIRGNHTMRFGGEYTHSAINHLQTNNNTPRGEFTFSGGITGSNGTAGGTPNYFRTIADYLLGLPQQLGKTVQLFQPNGPRFSNFGFYAQDTWKASANLTLNYGLRYEFYPFANRDHTGVFRFDPTTSNVLIGGRGAVPTNTGVDVGKGQIVPRFGINYRIDEKTVIRSGFGITVDPENFRFYRDSYPALITLNNVGSTNYVPAGDLDPANVANPAGNLTVGIPNVAVPDIGSGVVPMPYNYTTTLSPQKWRRGYVESFNLFVDRDLGKNVVANVGYVGTHQVRQVAGIDINSGSVSAAGNASRPLFTNPNAPGNINGVPRRYSGQILDVMPYGTVSYSGLQAQVTDRQLRSLQFGYAYTWSHALNTYDTNSTLGPLTFNSAGLIGRNYANSGFDRTHVNALWTVWQLPIGPGRQFLNGGLLGRVLGGFDLNTITTYVSGQPFQITDGGLAGNGDTPVPNLVSKPSLGGIHYVGANTNPAYFVNNGNFVSTGGGAAGNGNIGRNTLRGPGGFNLDAGITRNVPIYRELNIVLKAEAFGLTNTPQFNNPTANLTDGNFGRVTAAGGSRTLRLSGRVSF